MRVLGRTSWVSLCVVGAVFFIASANVCFAPDLHICCDPATGGCVDDFGLCDIEHNPPETCSTGEVCENGLTCSFAAGACILPGVGCTIVNSNCVDVLNCRFHPSCTLVKVPEEPSEEPVRDEDKDPMDRPEAKTTGDRATWPITALLLVGLMILPAAPMVIRRWSRRK